MTETETRNTDQTRDIERENRPETSSQCLFICLFALLVCLFVSRTPSHATRDRDQGSEHVTKWLVYEKKTMHFMQIVFKCRACIYVPGPENDEKCAKRFLDLSPEGRCDAFLDFNRNVCLGLCEARWGTGGDVIFSTFGA